MPRLRTLCEVGICSGYGDGDYSLHIGEVERLSVADMNELRKAFIFAITAAEAAWRDAQMKKPENQAAQAKPSDIGSVSGEKP